MKYTSDKSKASERIGNENINKLEGDRIYHLLIMAKNKGFDKFLEMGKVLGRDNINKLSAADVYLLIVDDNETDANNIERLIDIIGSYNINKLDKNNIEDIYHSKYDEERERLAILLKKYGNDKIKEYVDRLKKS